MQQECSNQETLQLSFKPLIEAGLADVAEISVAVERDGKIPGYLTPRISKKFELNIFDKHLTLPGGSGGDKDECERWKAYLRWLDTNNTSNRSEHSCLEISKPVAQELIEPLIISNPCSEMMKQKVIDLIFEKLKPQDGYPLVTSIQDLQAELEELFFTEEDLSIIVTIEPEINYLVSYFKINDPNMDKTFVEKTPINQKKYFMTKDRFVCFMDIPFIVVLGLFQVLETLLKSLILTCMQRGTKYKSLFAPLGNVKTLGLLYPLKTLPDLRHKLGALLTKLLQLLCIANLILIFISEMNLLFFSFFVLYAGYLCLQTGYTAEDHSPYAIRPYVLRLMAWFMIIISLFLVNCTLYIPSLLTFIDLPALATLSPFNAVGLIILCSLVTLFVTCHLILRVRVVTEKLAQFGPTTQVSDNILLETTKPSKY